MKDKLFAVICYTASRRDKPVSEVGALGWYDKEHAKVVFEQCKEEHPDREVALVELRDIRGSREAFCAGDLLKPSQRSINRSWPSYAEAIGAAAVRITG